LKYDGCGLIRIVGRALGLPVKAMLTTFHLFHHYQWCARSVRSLDFPREDLPAVCLACLLAASKAEDINIKIRMLMPVLERLQPNLPPFEKIILPLGKMPTKQEASLIYSVADYEYKVQLSRGFDLDVDHPTDLIADALVETGAPEEVGEAVFKVLCSRTYTDSTLCLKDDPEGCLCAAFLYAVQVN
ncbi:unnamed protein product, partial [Discosporangium mesarthrocarpum]